MKSTARIPSLTCAALAFGLVAFVSPSSPAATFRVIQTFNCTANSGCGPSGPLALDQSGNLYGSALGGGPQDYGVVFELSPNPDGTWSETILHTFDFEKDGAGPSFGVTFDGAGNLYGTTSQTGGPQDLGTVYELTPQGGGWTISLLNNYAADSNLLPDQSGNVYGSIGLGDYEGGAVSELSPGPDGWTDTAIYSFCSMRPQCPDGLLPSLLVFDARGNLYGTTLYGGNKLPYCSADPQGCGVAFELTSNRDGTWTYHIIHAFAAFANDAQLADGALLVDRNDGLYGTAPLGGPNYDSGMVFKFTPSTVGTAWKESAVYTFPDCSQGCGPYYGVVMDKAGNLYWVAGGGAPACGGGACGIVYELSPQQNGKWKYTKLHEFSGPDGMFPNAVTVGPDGNIYGTTQAGGKYNLGVAFEITP